MKKHLRIIFIYIGVSILGFIALEFVLNKYTSGLVESTDNLPLMILFSSAYVLISTWLYLFVIFLIASAGYIISRFRGREEFITAFKYLSWIHLAILILFSIYWVIG